MANALRSSQTRGCLALSAPRALLPRLCLPPTNTLHRSLCFHYAGPFCILVGHILLSLPHLSFLVSDGTSFAFLCFRSIHADVHILPFIFGAHSHLLVIFVFVSLSSMSTQGWTRACCICLFPTVLPDKQTQPLGLHCGPTSAKSSGPLGTNGFTSPLWIFTPPPLFFVSDSSSHHHHHHAHPPTAWLRRHLLVRRGPGQWLRQVDSWQVNLFQGWVGGTNIALYLPVHHCGA